MAIYKMKLNNNNNIHISGYVYRQHKRENQLKHNDKMNNIELNIGRYNSETLASVCVQIAT